MASDAGSIPAASTNISALRNALFEAFFHAWKLESQRELNFEPPVIARTGNVLPSIKRF